MTQFINTKCVIVTVIHYICNGYYICNKLQLLLHFSYEKIMKSVIHYKIGEKSTMLQLRQFSLCTSTCSYMKKTWWIWIIFRITHQGRYLFFFINIDCQCTSTKCCNANVMPNVIAPARLKKKDRKDVVSSLSTAAIDYK